MRIDYSRIAAVVFAAGKSSRMGCEYSKMREYVVNNGVNAPMIHHTLRSISPKISNVIVLVGYDGNAVCKVIKQAFADVTCVKVCQNNAVDLPSNSGGTLKKAINNILPLIDQIDHIILSVGDQPFMLKETIDKLIERHCLNHNEISMLMSDSSGSPIMQSTSTRIIMDEGDKFHFYSPTQAEDKRELSTLIDTGVLILTKKAFCLGVAKLKENEPVGYIAQHLANSGQHVDFILEQDIKQFSNINQQGDITSASKMDASIITAWIKWNIEQKRQEPFSIFNYPSSFTPEFEMDTTLYCQGTKGCKSICTYRLKHEKQLIELERALFIIKSAQEQGFKSILFSGGGENLDPYSYKLFLQLLTFAKSTGLKVYLATNGVFCKNEIIHEIVHWLDGIRFSIPPNITKGDGYSHLETIGQNILNIRKWIDEKKLNTKVYASVLLSPEMSEIEISNKVLGLVELGVDEIRFKAIHENIDGQNAIRINEYNQVFNNINSIIKTISSSDVLFHTEKLETIIHDPHKELPFSNCYYRDFNPLVVGADGHNYACCELKYQSAPFDYGLFETKSAAFIKQISATTAPQIISEKCFKGCKGYIINRDLQFLLEAFTKYGEDHYLSDTNCRICHDRLLNQIARNIISN